MSDWSRSDIESMRSWEMPSVRCRVDVKAIKEDGSFEMRKRDTTGRIIIDGNNPWIELSYGSLRNHAERFSWGLVLEVLNDKYAAPVHFQEVAELEI